MKKYFLLLAVIFPSILFAQGVSVNTDGSQPHNSAMLDISSTTRGLLMPRLTTLQRTSIASPAAGLTVYDTETASFWMYRGDVNGGWAELLHNFNKHWDRTGTNIFTTNPGNVGIGTNSPTEKLTINATEPAINFLNAGSAKGYIQANGSNMRLGTYVNNTTGNIVFNTRAADRMWIDENGKVGVGTASPTGLLTVNGANPWISMQNNGVDKGFLQAFGNDLKLGTHTTNTTGNLVFQTKVTDRMLIDENGKVGIGTNNPSTALTINGTDPMLQMRNGNVDKGFVALVDDDLKIGTNTLNSFGSFIVRTSGADRMSINHAGMVGINATGGWYNMLAIGENTYGQAGVDFKVNNSIKGTLNFTNNAGYLTQYGGTLTITTSGSGIVLHSDGNFSMGNTNTATGYRLSVWGKVMATDFTALPTNNWPDYVFANDYKLKPLADVKKFIAANKHLPNIPAAVEIEKNGIQLGDMSKRLMEKVEELTLYIIQLQDQVDELKKQIPQKKEN